MKIYLVGVAGYPNYGDELILKNWVEYILEKYPDAELWVDVPSPTIIECYFNNRNIRVTNAIWRLIGDFKQENQSDFFNILHQKICHLAIPAYDLSILKLREMDIFHIVGGGYINKMWRNNIGVLHIAGILKREFDKKIYLTGAGLLPLAMNVMEYKNLLNNFDYAESRDIEGANLLNIKLGYDDAYLNQIDQYGSFGEWRDIPDVVVCIQHDLVEQQLFHLIIHEVKKRLMEYREQSLTIGYIEAIPGLDRIAYEHLKDLIPENMFFTAADILQKGLPVKENQVWYTTRFHHHLEASLLGLKGVAININTGYYDIKHTSLLRNGTGWAFWDAMLDELPYPSLDENFSIKLEAIFQDKKKVAEYLYPDPGTLEMEKVG